MATTYTAPSGNTPQGQQQAQSITSLQAQIAQGAPMSSAQDQATESLYNTTAQRQTDLNTPGQRQNFLDNTNIAPMQNNYDQLAQQLAQYDKVVLQPQFAGQNPGMPSDLPQNPYVTYGDVSYVTPGQSLTPQQGVYNANPAYALSAQATHGNNIVDLMSMINEGLKKETNRGTAQYTGQLRAVDSTLGTLAQLMGLSTDLKMKQMSLASSKSGSEDKIGLLATRLGSVSGRDGFVSPQNWARIKKEATGMGIDPVTFDTMFKSSFANPQNRYYNFESPFGQLPAGQQTKATFSSTALDQLNRFKQDPSTQQGMKESGIVAGNLSKALENTPYANMSNMNLVTFQSRVGPLRDAVYNYISGAGVTGAEADRLKSWIPDRTKSPEKNAEDLISLENYLKDTYKNTVGQDFSPLNYGGSTTSGSSGSNNNQIQVGRFKVEVSP